MHGRLITSYGFDPSLRHGALVSATTMVGYGPPSIIQAQLVYSWSKDSPLTLTEKSSPELVYALVQSIVSAMRPVPGRFVAMDYDDRAAYWTRRPGQVAKLQFLSGYFARAVQSCGIPIVMFSPVLVRRMFGLKENVDKDTVWEAFCNTVELGLGVPRDLMLGDARDALILAFLVAAAQEQLYESRFTQTTLSRSRAQAADALEAPIKALTAGRSAR